MVTEKKIMIVIEKKVTKTVTALQETHNFSILSILWIEGNTHKEAATFCLLKQMYNDIICMYIYIYINDARGLSQESIV